MHGLALVAPGYGLRDLSRGKHLINHEFGKQLKRRTGSRHCCVKCGAHMAAPTLYNADAGQAYEMIKPSRIERAFRIIFKCIQIRSRLENPTISCIHSTKAKTRFGGWIRDRLNDRTVFFLSKVSHCMRGLVKLRWFKFGNLFLHQRSGIPIGGPVSGAVLEGVLSIDEDMFDKFGWVDFSKKFGLKGKRELWISIVRYVDDVFAASRWLCPDCVARMVDLIYVKTVKFDAANEGLTELRGFRVVKFLDLWCYMSRETNCFALVHKNDPFFFFRLGQPKIQK